jgi:hypothetical protein
MIFGKTKYCIVSGCSREATEWTGWVIKSRDGVKAGFCSDHTGMPCPNVFNKKNCYGIYNKNLQIISE